MANSDIQLLFSVLGGGSLSGESGTLIQSELTQIMDSMNKNPLKVKVALDTASANKSNWTAQLQRKLDSFNANNKLSIAVSDIKLGTGAITSFKNQLGAVINTLNLDKDVSVSFTSKDVGEITHQFKSAGGAADAAAKRVAEFKVQMEMLTAQKSSVRHLLTSLDKASGTDEERAKVAELNALYGQWAVKIEAIRASKTAASGTVQAELTAEGEAIRANISALFESARASKERAEAEAQSARQAESAEAARMATLNEVISAYRKINDFINKNPRIVGTSQHTQLVSMRDELAAVIEKSNRLSRSAKGAEKNLSTMSRVDLRTMLNDLSQMDVQLTEAGKKGKTFVGLLQAAYQKFGGWMLVTRTLMMALNGIRSMVRNVVELDAAMTELRKVTDATEASYTSFFDNAIARSKGLGATLTDTITATADFARLGYSIVEAADLADAALVYKNVGDGIEDISTASESIISTMKAFRVESYNAMLIVDKFNEVGNNFAISSKGVGDALVRSASALAAAGNSIDESIALIAAANTIVQNPDVVGTTMKTLSMYLRAAKTEAEEAGESTDGMANSVSELRGEILALTGGKVDIQVDEDTFKNTTQILRELSAVWDELTDISQANILEMIGGKRNANTVSALIENFEIVEEVIESSTNAAGSALAENEKYLNSINGKLAQFRASFQALSSTLIDSELVKGIVDFGTTILDTVNAIAKTLGTFPTLIGSVTAAITAYQGAKGKNFGIFDVVDGNVGTVWTALKNNISEYNALTKSSTVTQGIFLQFLEGSDEALAGYLKSLNGGKASMSGYRAYCKQAGIETKAFGNASQFAAVKVTLLNTALNMIASMIVGLAIQGIVTGLNALVNAASIASEKADELAESTREQAKAQMEEMKTLDELVERFKQLRESEFIDSDTREQIRGIQEEIVKLVGAEAGEIDLVNGKLDDTLDKLREKQKIQASEALDSAKAAYNAAVDAENKAVASSSGSFAHPAFGQWAYVGDRDKEAEEILRNAGYGLTVSPGGWFNNSTYISDYWDKDGNFADTASEKMDVVKGMIDALKAAGDTDSEVFTKLQQQYEAYNDYVNKTSDAAKTLLDATYASEKYNDTLSDMSVDSIETYNQYREALIESIKNNEILQSALENGDLSYNDIAVYADDIMSKNYPEIFNDIAAASTGVDYALTDLVSTVTELQSAYDLLGKAQQEMASGAGLSAGTINSLAQANEDYLDYLYEENGVIKLNTEAWMENSNAKMKSEMLDIEREIASLTEQNKKLYERNKLLSTQPQTAENTSEIDANTQAITENSIRIRENQGLLAVYGGLFSNITGDLTAFSQAMNGFEGVANTIDSVAASYASLANLQNTVANGFTLSLEKILEYAKAYPQILNNATVTADGELALNEAVVNSFIEGQKEKLSAQIDGQIAELEADKAVLEAKKEFATAQLELAKAAINGESEMNAEFAAYRINLGNGLVEALIAMKIDESDAYRLATAAMAGNEEEFARVAAECFENVDENSAKAAYDMAQAFFTNSKNSSISIAEIAAQAHQTALAIAGMVNGVITGSSKSTFNGAGGVYTGGFGFDGVDSTFKGTEYDYQSKTISLDDYIADLELDIKDYEETISQIDGQIATLEALKSTPFKNFKNLVDNASSVVGGIDAGSGSSSGSSTDSSGADEMKDAEKIVEEYIAAIDQYYEALKRLEAVQEKRQSMEKKLEHTSDLSEKIFLSSGLVDLYREETDAERNLMAAKQATISANVGALRGLGFQVEYDSSTNELYIKNLEHLNSLTARTAGKYDTLQEATNALRQETEELIDTTEQLNQDNIEAAGNIEDIGYQVLDTKNDIVDYIEEIYDKQVESYQKIIDLRKELIESAKEEYDYEADVADKVKEIAELQARIDQLALDDSRGAQAERNSLIQELAEKQKDLADTQGDHATDAQVDALDKMAADYADQKSGEIQVLRDTVNASEELWTAFYQTIMGQNVDIGNSIDETVARAWIRAAEAVNEYSASVQGISADGAAITSVPRYHNGGIVDESDISRSEALAILQKGEVVLNEGEQQVLYRVIDFQTELAKRLGSALGAINIPNPSINANSLIGDTAHSIVGGSQSLVFEPHIEVAINHNGAMADTDAEFYGDKIANTTIDKLYSAFERRGINSTRGSRLKP